MSEVAEIKEGLEKSISFHIIKEVRQMLVNNLPQGKSIDDATDEEFERAYWMLMDEIDMEPDAERPEKFKPCVEEADT